jgi:hypothetical protein
MTTAGGATPGRGGDRPAGLAVTAMLWLATLLLPRGVSRNRYRREFAAEVYGQPTTRQLAYALSVCGHVWSLRTVLLYGDERARIPFLCRTNLHHHWQKHANDQGLVYRTCSRCGHEKGDLPGSGVDALFLPMGVDSTNHRSPSRLRPAANRAR